MMIESDVRRKNLEDWLSLGVGVGFESIFLKNIFNFWKEDEKDDDDDDDDDEL